MSRSIWKTATEKSNKKMRKLHPLMDYNCSIFLDWASISSRRHVFHTVASILSCIMKIGWAPPMSTAAPIFFPQLNQAKLVVLRPQRLPNTRCPHLVGRNNWILEVWSHCQVLPILLQEELDWKIVIYYLSTLSVDK
jgi:hypothetical protein